MVQEGRPLRGRTIVVTRPRDQAEETVKAIEARGGKAYLFPTIEITAPRDLSAVKGFFKNLSSKKVDYVILMSVNGVQHLLSAAESLGVKDGVKKSLEDTVVMAVGPKTAQELEKNRIHVELTPEKYTSEGILQCLKQRRVKGKMIYIPRTSEAPPALAEKLREMGNRVEEVYVYQSQIPKDRGLAERFAKDLADEKVDAIVFSSSLGARNFFEMLTQVLPDKKLKNLIQKRTVVVAIGPTTAKTLTEANVKVDVMPEKHTLDEALDALVNYWNVHRAPS
jgi:uroporphyrinogen-III synthase